VELLSSLLIKLLMILEPSRKEKKLLQHSISPIPVMQISSLLMLEEVVDVLFLNTQKTPPLHRVKQEVL